MSTGRVVGFYAAVVAALLLVVSALFDAFALTVVSWFGTSRLQELYPDVVAIDSHRIHLFGVAALGWLLVVPTAVQLVRPATKIAAAIFGLAFILILIPTDLATGFFDPLELVGLVLFVAIAWLHPARATMSFTPINRRTSMVAVVGAVGWVTLAVVNLVTQLTGSAANHHVALGHFGIMAQVTAGIALAAAIGVSALRGGRIIAVLAGAVAAYVGLASVLYPGYASSLGVPGGLLAIAWAGLYVWSAFSERTQAWEPADTASLGHAS
jgi:hypothetical protein